MFIGAFRSRNRELVRIFILLAPLAVSSLASGVFEAARADAPGACQEAASSGDKPVICWEIQNRFRLFANKDDFELHERAWIATKAERNSVLAMERWLNDGPGATPEALAGGWARQIVNRLCFNEITNSVSGKCIRDRFPENYMNPISFAVKIKLAGVLPAGYANANCIWTVADVKLLPQPCTAPVEGRRINRKGAQIVVSIQAPGVPTITPTPVSARPRNILVVGMGDSFGSGEGNPDDPVKLKPTISQGICFTPLLPFAALQTAGIKRSDVTRRPDTYLPSRDNTSGGACNSDLSWNDPSWVAARAHWLYAPCHRSLYSHQTRAAIALAIEEVHRTVTYVPLACTGATISNLISQGQAARESALRNNNPKAWPSHTQAQIDALRKLLKESNQKPDLLFLSIGGNDVGFAPLVADVIVRGRFERAFLSGLGALKTPEQSLQTFGTLAASFRSLRAKLKPILDGNLSRVVYVPYANPVSRGGDKACGNTKFGFDGDPTFSLDGSTAKSTSQFVEEKLIPRIVSLATCTVQASFKPNCIDASHESMRVALAHRPAFESHAVCEAYSGTDKLSEPQFDRGCFRDGGTFRPEKDTNALKTPFAHCILTESFSFRPYAIRARWSRTPNDAFLSSISYVNGIPAQSAHDALWSLTSMVYGGAIHPTSEGHAAMADSALIEARAVLATSSRFAGTPEHH